jgi:glutamate-1-semialdehyde 2,1-aminomutase
VNHTRIFPPMTNPTNTSPSDRPSVAASRAAFERASRVMPGGVSSPVRAFRAVGGTPRFIRRAQGCYLWDEDGTRFIDLVGSWGPMILGHAHPEVIAAIHRRVDDGTSFGAPTTLEAELAEEIIAAMPRLEMVRFVNSGTEAAMSAIRLARAATGRSKLIKFKGNYHGHVDSLLVAAGSGAATFGTPSSPGVPAAVVADTLLADYNDLAGVTELFDAHGDDIAAILIEPIAGNMGFVRASGDFLRGLRTLADRHGALLVFDEVMTGFRVAHGGAEEVTGVRPDLTCLGKVIGGGMPVGAYGGPRGIMERVSPVGPVYQAGTLSGNPIAMTAGIETLRRLSPETYSRLSAAAGRLCDGLRAGAQEAGLPLVTDHEGGMLGFFFADEPVRDFTDAQAGDHAAFARFFHEMLGRGVYLAPSSYEALFISTAHTDEVIGEIIAAARESFAAVAAATATGDVGSRGA